MSEFTICVECKWYELVPPTLVKNRRGDLLETVTNMCSNSDTDWVVTDYVSGHVSRKRNSCYAINTDGHCPHYAAKKSEVERFS